ncbi:TauD/TfdA family dioxygenase [Sphaerisporangium corydalis]|uniref:TauD/TfdA family dioxygenase n=1 Tax=Sphaerisporangium corydalis TaxID=1441875 RepID=A0ABV9EBY7_9ACTN|nr:TauD/TfdA family dioxygenase [Sphaerisporangium corydalis]
MVANDLDADLLCTVDPGRPATAYVAGVDTIERATRWLTARRERVRELLDEHGALFLRGLPIADAAGFAAVRDAVLDERAPYQEKATPRTDFGDGVFSSTDLPPAHTIRMHNENSYTLTFPGILMFCCLTAPRTGGATPVADCREVLRNLPGELAERFRGTGWSLLRNYGENISLDWRTAFNATSADQVEKYCAENLITYRWGEHDTLRTGQVRPAVIRHPRTGDEVWFNHAAFWSEHSLEPEIRDVLLQELGREGLPFNTRHGDGTEFTAEEVGAINAAYDAAVVRRAWQAGDLLIVDNLLAAHGRDAFRGDRKIVVAMGEPVSIHDCRPVPPLTAHVGA